MRTSTTTSTPTRGHFYCGMTNRTLARTLANPRAVGSKLKCPVLVASEMSGLGLITNRRGCGKVGIPRTVRDFQARRESRLLDFSASCLFHSPTRADFFFLQRFSCRTVMPETLGAVRDRESSVQVLVHRHSAARQGGAPAHRFNLQAQVLRAYRVVAVDGTFELQGKDV